MPVLERLCFTLSVFLQRLEQNNREDLLVLTNTYSARAWRMKKMEITGMNSGFSNMRLHVLLQQLYRGPSLKGLSSKFMSCFQPI